MILADVKKKGQSRIRFKCRLVVHHVLFTCILVVFIYLFYFCKVTLSVTKMLYTWKVLLL